MEVDRKGTSHDNGLQKPGRVVGNDEQGLIFGNGVQAINMNFAVIHPDDDVGKIIYNSVHHGLMFKKQIKFAKKQLKLQNIISSPLFDRWTKVKN